MWKQKSIMVFIIGLSIGMILWIQMGLYLANVLFNLQVSANIFHFCLSLFKKTSFLYSLLIGAVNLFIAYHFIIILIKIGKQMFLSKQLIRKILTNKNHNMTVEVNERFHRHKSDIVVIHSRNPIAFTFGFRRSIIVLSTSLIEILDYHELKAVISHETSHQKSYDAFKIFILQIISKVIWYIPITKWSYQNYKIMCELKADEYAIRKMGSEMSLSNALLKLIKTHMKEDSAPVLIGFTDGSINYRLQQLINPQATIPVRLQMKSIITSAYVFIVLMALMVMN
ncbi:M56 family metallopeptidase [Bacillus sp. 03113]|uniref:M56 family metallopeptidase n=1 Tax=Bacillus sp. 03113 TaxID=2578211 RepID=UPI001143363D|nr:M56 family metallopeptidase [Bacillus sp. 03113]